MNIQEWFDCNGSFEAGVNLYKKLPYTSNNLLRSFKTENFSNFLTLKYELKKALERGNNVNNTPIKTQIVLDTTIKTEVNEDDELKFILEASKKKNVSKETMAMYPVELHETYRLRISKFYKACELKFLLNRVPQEDDRTALKLILQLEDLWSDIDKYWVILNYWTENNRLMPIDESRDFSKLSPMELHKEKALIETRISKRKKTISGFISYLESNPDDVTKRNLYNKKLEELEQLMIDFENIKKLING